MNYTLSAGNTPDDYWLEYIKSGVKVLPTIYSTTPILLVSLEDYKMMIDKKMVKPDDVIEREPK